ncbi:ankyrin repeat domain-containing protein [Nitratireductor aquibiodomus]|uniref:ankyrin repeat domain-containing protein n=1 Tax=Nitratireductor aquibiodomus TaxID=204799 RepID=UPI0004683CDD|nr:ankyrin repeat domain-containing protein [Nitratireductor aquibiodomus]
MSLQPKRKVAGQRLFARFQPMDGHRRASYSLLRAIYMDNIELAATILEADPRQLNRGDPYAGLTPLHIAIFRQSEDAVSLLLGFPDCDLWQADSFGRTPVDMLAYSASAAIFELVMRRAYPDQERAWDSEALDLGWASGRVVSLNPKATD